MPSIPDTHSPVGIKPPGYRLPEATRLGRVRLQISNLTHSLSFYTEILGLHVLDRSKNRALLGVQQREQVLVELIERPGAYTVQEHSRLGLYHLAFLLPSRTHLARFLGHLAEAGIRPGMSNHHVSEALYFRDPDGLGIEVYADRPRGSWEHTNGQIAMATEPLDSRHLIQDAGEEKWSGAPSGTTVGHVHLHVGHLHEGAAFFHEGLGFDKTVWRYPGALFLSAGGYHHHLGINTWAGTASPAGENEAKLLEWTIVVPGEGNAEAAAHSLREAGYETVRHGPSWHATDPWGIRVRLTTDD